MPLTCWPDTALRWWHVKKVCDEESMVVLGFTVQANARAACISRVLLRMIHAQSNSASIRVD